MIVTTRADVDHVLHHPALFSSAVSAADLKNERPLIPLQIDPPEHRKFRKLLNPPFAPQPMALLEEPVRALAHRLIDDFAGDRQIDFARRFSVPYPSQVILTMLGLPLDELPRLLAMKDGIIRPGVVVGHPAQHPEAQAHQAATARSIYEYFDGVLDERAGEAHDDLLGFLVDAEIEGDRLTREEILDTCFLLLIAGLDTVSASLDCFFAHLVDHPDRRRAIVDDPGIVPDVVEELLRWETPVVGVPRIATAGPELGGCPIAAGEHVIALLGSANTDDEAFEEAGEVVLGREANHHLAFGGGAHRCLGSHLARIELRVALEVWHERIPEYHLPPGTELEFTNGIRSAEAFPMVLGPAG